MLDLVLRNGRIVDGTGNPWFIGDVGVKDGRITHVGRVDQESAHSLDVRGQAITPGFIDGHSHSDLLLLDQPNHEFKLQQGVTTEVVGNCGLAPAPMLAPHKHSLMSYVEPVLGRTNWEWDWTTVEDYISRLTQSRASAHSATYVAHGSLRIAVMGFANRPATPQEVDRMKTILAEGMKAGALGLSIGLLYAPGSYTSREELAELCEVVARHGGLLATHIRGEGNNLLPSVKEVIWIAEKSGVSLHISHLKAAGKINWGSIADAMDLIEAARSRGMDVTCDVYPYAAGSTSLTTILPPWSLEGGIEAVLERLKDPSLRARIKAELRQEQEDWDNLIHSTGWQSVTLSAIPSEANQVWEGKHIQQISDMTGKDPEDVMMDLLLAEEGKVSIVYFHMSERDVSEVIRYDRSLIASDSLGCVTGKPHPRSYGTFPRLLGKYVRDEKLLTLEQAVRKITSFPVQRFQLGKRGLLVPGYHADLVVFDPQTIRDAATFEDPVKYPEGIAHVWVAGEQVMEAGKHTGNRPGGFLAASGGSCGCHRTMHEANG